MTLNGAPVTLKTGLLREDNILYVPLEAVEKALSYTGEWDVEENTLELTFAGSEERSIPYAYDYRDTGRAPRVKNQGICFSHGVGKQAASGRRFKLFRRSYVHPEQFSYETE